MAMVAVVLLVTCANIANLMLARAAARARDVAIRISLGATTGRLIRQCLTESIILASVGGAAGLLAAAWASELLAHQVLNKVRRAAGRVCARCTGLRLCRWSFAPDRGAFQPRARASRDPARDVRWRSRQLSVKGVGQASMKGMRQLVAESAGVVGRRGLRRRADGANLDQLHEYGSGVQVRRSSRDREVRSLHPAAIHAIKCRRSVIVLSPR